MNNESVFLRKLLGFLMAIAVAIIGMIYVFRNEVVEITSDTFANNQFAAKHVVTDDDLAKVTTFTLRPERNDAALIRVTNLRPGAQSAIGTPILFMMTNEGEGNDFPSIQVILNNSHGAHIRDLTFSPGDYQHADRFEKQDVEIILNLNGDESGFTVKPFYAGQK